MKVAIEPVYDRYGGMYPYTEGIKKYSAHKVKEVPPRLTRAFLNRSQFLKLKYKECVKRSGLKGYHAIHSMADPWFMDLAVKSRSSKCKWLHTYHIMFFDEDYMEGLQPWQEETNRYQIEVASKADVKISTSKWIHDYLLENHSIQTDIVMGGIDVGLCQEAKGKRFINKYGFSDFVLFVGSIRENKNPGLFIELAAHMPDTRFVMIGPGLNQPELKKKFDIELTPNVVLMDKMKRGDVLDAMAACTVYVLTSKHEGFPQSVLEAMAIGRVVVSSSYVGSKELIPSEDYGFLFRQGSIDELIEKTKQALNSKGVAERAQERVVNNYDWKILAKRIDNLYES